MSDDVVITVRVNNATGPGITSVNQTINRLSRSARDSDGAFKDWKATLLSLAPAAVPVAASLAPIAAHAGAAGVAVAAFGAAVIPQIANLKSAADAQDKYTQAVTKYGAGSKQAAQAQVAVADTLAGMPAATQRAAAGYSNLRDQFKNFSDSTAKFTMVPVEHSFAILGAVLPKLKPMVEGTSTQLDRLMKVAGGAVNTAGFDALSKKFSDFANNSLRSATDGAIHFIRVMSEGNAKGPLTEFMAYAKAQGPAVRDLLSNLMRALGNIAKGAAQAGPGMLSLVNAFAKLVAAAPPQLIGNLMQVYAAFKLIKLGGAGLGTVADGVKALSRKIVELRAVSVAAGGGLTGLKAAFLSLGAAAKATVVLTVLAGLALAAYKLSSSSKEARVSVDELAKSIEDGLTKGKISSSVLDDLRKAQQGLVKDTDASASAWDKFVYSFKHGGEAWSSSASSSKAAANDFRDLGKAIGDIAKNKGVDTARQALDLLNKQGYKIPTKYLKDYNSAVADAALESKLTAQSMGVFGQAAQDTTAKLQAQKNSADALRQSILALNDVNRSAYDAQIGFEQAVDDLSAAFKKNGATLNLHTQAGRDNAKAMSEAAKSQDELIASGVAAGDSLASMVKKSGELRTEMLKLATQAFDGNKKKAQEYVNTLLGTPKDIKTLVELERKDAIKGLKDVQTAIAKTPNAKSITVDTLNGAAIKALEAVGLKVKRLPNGKVNISAGGKALGTIGAVAAALRALNGRTAVTYIKTVRIGGTYGNKQVPLSAHGGLLRRASGGSVSEMQHFDQGGYIQGPGSGTSDSILATFASGAMSRVSNSEYVVQASAVRKYGVGILDALNQGRLKVPGRAKGGLSQSAKDARKELDRSFGISYFGRQAGYHRTPFEHALGAPTDINALVDSLNQAAGKIKAAFSGKTESNLLKHLNSVGRALISQEKQLNKVTASLSSAKDKLNSLKDASSQLASSVKGNLISSANITKNQSGGPVTLASVKAGLKISKDKVTAFASALKALKAKGFSASIIQQVAEAGIDGGGLETAGALLQASSSEVKTINSTQAQIESAAGSAGKTTASAVYDAAIKAQTAVVDRLTKQQEKLEKSMASLAKSMEKLIQKALGHKAAGGIVGAAASGGLRGGLTMVGEHGFELLDLPAGARVWSNPDSRRKLAAGQPPWASMLTAPRRAGSAAVPVAVPGGTDRPIVLHVSLGGREFGQLWIDVGRKEVKTRGGLTAALGS
ncbi:phage tail protein [Streptomyces sp. NPDC004059]